MKLKAIVSLVCILLIFCSNMAYAAPAQADWSAVDQYISAQMRAGGIPGLSLAVVQGDQVVYQKGYGEANPAGDPVTPQTPFLLGSLSKSLTALAVMQLVEAGKIELDAPVQRYLPWFGVYDPQSSAQITVRHLLNQTSGLPEVVGVKNLADGDLSDGALEKHVRSLSRERLTQPVGAAFQYCNANYTTLGMIVQAVSGMPYERYIQERVFTPLNMQHSYTSQAEAADPELASTEMSTGYRQWFGVPLAAPGVPYIRGDVPAGYLIASAEDMAHFLIANLNEGRYGSQALVTPEGMMLLHQPSGVPGVGFRSLELNGQYGMGWFVGELDGKRIIHHGGSTANFQSYMILEPESRLGLVVLTNVRTPNDLSLDLASGVFRILSGGAAPAARRYPANPGLAYLAVPVIMLVEFAWSALAIRRWRSAPERRPREGLAIFLQMGLPAILTLAVLGLAYWALSGTVSLPLFFTFEPASAWLAAACGAFALVWGVVRTWLWMKQT